MGAGSDVLSRPSPLERYESGLPGSAWLLFVGVSAILGGFIIYNATENMTLLLLTWVLGGLLGYIGYVALVNALKIERLRLAAHMLRSLSLHAVLASSKGSDTVLKLVFEAERKERGFIIRAFRAAGVGIEQALVGGVLDGLRRGAEPPYILVYRNGVLDAPSTLVANLTARTMGSVFALFAFVFMGLILLVVSVVLGSVIIYATSRTLRKHARLENEIRRQLGLSTVPAEAPGAGGMIASILTFGLYLPLYARKLTEGLDMHIRTH